jgi:sterol 3beta-glucosyltransferase
MANLAIIASGSRGDVQPYIALGTGLKALGHKVTVLSNENFEALVREAGLDFASTGPNVQEVLQSDEWRDKAENRNFLKILADGQKYMKDIAEAQARELPKLLAGQDMVIGGLAALTGGLTIADMLKIPFIQAYVFPFTASREFSSPLVADLPLGQLLNRPSFHLTHQMFWQIFKDNDNITRRVLGLGKGSFWGPFKSLAQRDEPVLYGYSKHVLPRPNDWTSKYHVTGYWYLDESSDWKPSSELLKFLEAGDPPVYIGFGSMASSQPERTSEILIEALALSGQRGILASGWGGLKASDLPETVHLISSIPHSWLFPRVATVVHHGGAGTTAAGLRAGIPSILIPHGGDQAFWGKRLADLGVAPRAIPKKRLNAKALSHAIRITIENRAMREQAKHLGQNIMDEAGVSNASHIIHQYIEKQGIGVSVR